MRQPLIWEKDRNIFVDVQAARCSDRKYRGSCELLGNRADAERRLWNTRVFCACVTDSIAASDNRLRLMLVGNRETGRSTGF
jgi:hypothetical protein